MTTTAFDDQFTPATQTILRVNVIESQQQIHDLQLKLAAAIERATAAEAELAKLAQQKPVAWRHENGNIFLPWQKDLITTNAVFSPLYAAHVPAPAVPDDTAILDWLEMQRVDVASVVGHRPQYGFLSVGAIGKSDLRSKVIALLQSEVRHD